MTLLADITRCLDTGCPQNSRCARYLDRHTNTHERTPYVSTCWRPGTEAETIYPMLLERDNHAVRQ